jgi:hypothetical protein
MTPQEMACKAPILCRGVITMSRIIAYYGNLYSTRMGILGELPEKKVLAK